MSEITVSIFRNDRFVNLRDMIVLGKYGWVNETLLGNLGLFPKIKMADIGEFETKLFQFYQGVSTDEVKKRIEADDPANPWLPARIQHLLAFGEKFPDRQGRYAVVAINSNPLIGGHQHFPYLFGTKNIHYLGFEHRPDGTWRGDFTFLGVRRKRKELS